MALMIELTPEQEERLREEALRHGLREEEYLRSLVNVILPPAQLQGAPLFETLSAEEWQRVSRSWPDRRDVSIPPLSDYAVSREGMYEDHL
jgi:hypothetical protein